MRFLAFGSLLPAIALAATVHGDEPATTSPAEREQQGQQATAEPDRQIRLQVTIVEVSLSEVQRRKLDFAQFGLGQKKPHQQQLEREAAKKLLDSLTSQGVAKVLGAPTMVVNPRQPGYFFAPGKASKKAKPDREQSLAERKVGTEIHVTANLLSESRVQLQLRAKQTDIEPLASIARRGATAPFYRTREMDLPIEMDLGSTVVVGGLVQQETVRDPRTRRNVQRETETLVLISPDLFHAGTEGLAGSKGTRPDDAQAK